MARDDRDIYPIGGEGRGWCADSQYGSMSGYQCERVPGHPGDHAALIRSAGVHTVTWPQAKPLTPEQEAFVRVIVEEGAKPIKDDPDADRLPPPTAGFTDAQREAAIRRLAASMETPVYVLTQREVEEAEEARQRNSYAWVAEAPGEVHVVVAEQEEESDWARASLVLESNHGEIASLTLTAHQDDDNQYDIVRHAVANLIAALRGMGFGQ